MKKQFLLASLVVLVFPLATQAQTYYRPYYEERPMVNAEPVSYPYFLENRTGAPLTVYLYVNKVRWEFAVSIGHEVPAVMLPLGAKVRVEGFADVGNNKGRKKQKVYTAFYHRQDHKGEISRGWVLYR